MFGGDCFDLFKVFLFYRNRLILLWGRSLGRFFNEATGTNHDTVFVVEPKDPKSSLNELPDRMFFID